MNKITSPYNVRILVVSHDNSQSDTTLKVFNYSTLEQLQYAYKVLERKYKGLNKLDKHSKFTYKVESSIK
jgi:hypothetical protein